MRSRHRRASRIAIALLALPWHGVSAQRVAASPWNAAPRLRSPAPPALLVSSHRRATAFVVVGALIGGITGYAYYRHALGPSDEDFTPYISIPLLVGGGTALGAALGWLVAPRPASSRTHATPARPNIGCTCHASDGCSLRSRLLSSPAGEPYTLDGSTLLLRL